MGGKYDAAMKSFQDSLDQAKRIGMRSGAMEARSAIRRIERTQKAAASANSVQDDKAAAAVQ